jgi:CheY-like chemotaxis protein
MSRPDVLLIDACDAARYRLRLTLKSLGAEVRQARSVEAALPTLRARQPDLIITAPTLPGMNALDLLVLLRTGTVKTPPPLVIHCPDGDWPLAEAATAQGALAVVCGDALGAHLSGWLQQAASARPPSSDAGPLKAQPRPAGTAPGAAPPTPATSTTLPGPSPHARPTARTHCWGQTLAGTLLGLLMGLWMG